MKLSPPKNINYAAQVVRVRKVNVLPNCDNVVGIPVLGYQAIVSKDTEVGDLGIVFSAETQLSERYAAANNLHRHENLNADPTQKGYLEDNRRVKALKFRGHRSDALFMPLSSLSGFFSEWDQFKEGDTFDELEGNEICQKYVPRGNRAGLPVAKRQRNERVDDKLFPKHFDTPNYFRVSETILPEDHVVLTQKLHGTSIRVGHTLVERKLTWKDRLARFLGASIQEREWAYVYGSRNVTKDPSNPNLPKDFYGSDVYTEIGSRLEGLLPKGYIVYGEIIGWVPGTNTPIQKGYTYCLPEGVAELYVYRVAVLNEDGRTVDLSWSAVKEFCESIGLETVPELTSGEADEEAVLPYLDIRLADHFKDALPTDPGMVDEGVCLRVEGMTPLIVKAKSPKFFEYETKLLDKGEQSLEEDN